MRSGRQTDPRARENQPVAISRDEVLHVARLARLALTDEEVERLTEELGAILDAVGVVAELDLSEVPPTSHPLDLVNVWDEDEPRESLSLEDVFANAPDRDGDLFRVPPTA
jgi:aspartyl-tRNA(Asn)/glutamyl-tRNA(Gln) amidotransferase subunit C